MARRMKYGYGTGLPYTKKFSGRSYYLFTIEESKRKALRQAKTLREKGYSARIKEGREHFGVYSSPKYKYRFFN